MKQVKVTYPGREPERGDTPFPQQSPGGKGIWGDYQFSFDKEDKKYDYWIVVDCIEGEETCNIPKRNTIFLTQESPAIGAYPVRFLNQFGTILTCHQDIIENQNVFANKIAMQPALAWFVNKSYNELSRYDNIPKTKRISLITSKAHRKRYQFARALKNHFGDDLDLFGRGINPIADKWDALAPYEYSIVIENTKSPHYFSEKLADAYLALSYPIYYGDAAGYLLSYDYLDINNLNQTIKTIESLLNSKNHYTANLPLLKLSRDLILNTHNFFPTMISVFNSYPQYFDTPGTNLSDVTISNLDSSEKNRLMFLKKLRGRIGGTI